MNFKLLVISSLKNNPELPWSDPDQEFILLSVLTFNERLARCQPDNGRWWYFYHARSSPATKTDSLIFQWLPHCLPSHRASQPTRLRNPLQISVWSTNCLSPGTTSRTCWRSSRWVERKRLGPSKRRRWGHYNDPLGSGITSSFLLLLSQHFIIIWDGPSWEILYYWSRPPVV